jgi:hypothetical protein
MQCPDCGYEVDDTVVFCPRCRYQFRKTDTAPAAGAAGTHPPLHDTEIDDTFFEESRNGFSDKEIRLLEVQLLQPAVLVVVIIALFTYSLVLNVPFIPVTIAGLSFGVTGIVCLTCGLLAGFAFYYLELRSLVRFRYR